MPLDFTALEAEVTRDEDVTSSAITVIQTLMDEVEANKNDPATLQALVDRTRANTDRLGAAIATTPPAA